MGAAYYYLGGGFVHSDFDGDVDQLFVDREALTYLVRRDASWSAKRDDACVAAARHTPDMQIRDARRGHVSADHVANLVDDGGIHLGVEQNTSGSAHQADRPTCHQHGTDHTHDRVEPRG